MAGFADLVGRNAPALGVNRATYVVGDTWGDTLGVFVDNAGTVINLTSVTITVTIYDKPGGTSLATVAGTGTSAGTFSFAFSTGTTASLGSGARRDVVWNCTMTSGGSTITVWSAIESPLTILAD